MNLRDLAYLVAVHDLKHFRKAAERCNVTQPTLSGQLKKLEEYLGVTLIERGNRKVWFTEIGEAVVGRARVVLSECRAIEDMAASADDPMSASLQVGVIPTLAPYLLPRLLKPLKDRYPKLAMLLHEELTPVLVQRLKEGSLDLAILALPIHEESLEECALFDEPFWLAVAKEHPLAGRTEIEPGDLDGEAVLLLQDGHCLRDQALDVCADAGASEMAFQATSLETLRHMVGSGVGMTLIPAMAVPKSSAPDEPVAYLPFSAPAPSRSIGLLYRKATARRSCFEPLGQLIAEVVSIEKNKR